MVAWMTGRACFDCSFSCVITRAHVAAEWLDKEVEPEAPRTASAGASAASLLLVLM